MIPTYNQAEFLIRAINSAREQSYGNIEIMVADDCSTDQTKEIVENYITQADDSRISYYRNTANLGILRNYHDTLLRTTGDLVVNLDGDDFFVNRNFFKDAVSLFERDKDIILVFGDYCEYNQFTKERLDIVNKDLPEIISDRKFYSLFAANEIIWNHNTIIYKRKPAVELGFYWHSDILRNDWESFLRLIAGHKVGYLSSVEAAWVQHSNNETRRPDVNKYLNNYLMIKGVSLYARSHFEQAFVDRWYQQMILTKTKTSVTSYLINRDLCGLISFLKATSKVQKSLPFRAITSPSLILRALLAVNPSLYKFVKQIFRRLSL
jgi:glycosyltransferase involved in cell wall biosynthesis